MFYVYLLLFYFENKSTELAYAFIYAYSQNMQRRKPGPVFTYKLQYIVGFGLVEMATSTNPNPTIYRNLYENRIQATS